MVSRSRRWKMLLLAVALAVAAVPASPEVVRPPRLPPPPMLVAEGRVPVLLVPGWSDDASVLSELRARLMTVGWGAERTLALSFGDAVGSNRDHAREIADAVDALVAATGAPQVDIVAHSMGGLATRYFLAKGGAERVRRVVFLATPHGGTVSAFFAWGEGAREMLPGSAFLAELAEKPPLPEGIRALTIRTTVDVHVLPAESATLSGVDDVRICCPTHAGLLDDEEAFERIRTFLGDPP